MARIAKGALTYAAVIFAAGFCLGALRTLWLAPRIGALPAVAAELPVMLGLSWLVAGAVLRRWPVPSGPGRLALGGLAFLILMLAEAGLALAFGQTPGVWLSGLVTPAGGLGLAGQVAFALLPALRR